MLALGFEEHLGDNDLVVSSQRFVKHPQLIFLQRQTNLFAYANGIPPKQASLKPHDFQANNNNNRTTAAVPDFASDNDVLCKLLAWKFSDQMVSVVIHKIGNTLVLLGGSPPTFKESTVHSPADAHLVSGFDVVQPVIVRNSTTTTISLEEEKRLRLAASQQVCNAAAAAKETSTQAAQTNLDTVLHTLSGQPLTTANIYQIHSWNFHIMLKSCLRVYSHNASSSTLILRDYNENGMPRDAAVRLFLDNVLAGVSKVNVCYHCNGLVKAYKTFDTWDIPVKLAKEQIDVGDIEYNAQTLLYFLREHCEEDLSIHWLFKGPGERIARLWKLDPLNDNTLDLAFRDHVLFQHTMLCLGSSQQLNNRTRERLMVTKSLEMLDRCGELRNNTGDMLRRPLRAALRERLADLLLLCGEAIELCFEQLELALNLLLEQEEDGDSGLGLQSMAMSRIVERGLRWAIRKQDLDFLLQTCEWAERAQRLTEEVVALLAQCRKQVGEEFMSQAKQAAARGEFDLAKLLSLQAMDSFQRAAIGSGSKHCFFQLGNALNEYGKLLLREGKLSEARLVFSRGASAFREAGDVNNLAVLRCNVAHTFRLARTRETLVLALNELTAALEETTSNHWTQCLKSEIFKTMILLAKQLRSNRDEAWQVLNRALLEFASSAEECATAHFHMAMLRIPAQSPVEGKLARRHLEQVTNLLPDGHVLNAHARIELAELALEQNKTSHESILRTLLERLKEDDGASELKPKLVALLCKLLRKAHKPAYRCVLNEMLHPNPQECSNAFISRVKSLM